MARSRIAEAYVQIVPQINGFGSKLSTGLNQQLGAAGADGGAAMAKSTGQGFLGKIKGSLGPALAIIGTTFAAVKIGSFLSGAIEEATTLRTALAEVVTLTGNIGAAAAQDFGQFQNIVKDTSKEFGISQKILTDGLYNAISAGVPKDSAQEFLAVASQAAIAGVTDVNTSVDGLTTIMNAFGLSSGDAKAIADSMFTAVKGGKTNFEELSSSMSNVAPAAAAAGVKFTEINAALATLTVGGTDTSVASNQLKAALVGLQKPSDEMDAIFQALGYDSAQLAIESEGLGFAINAVSDFADGNNGTLQNLLGSTEAVSAVQVLAGTGAEKFAAELDAQTTAAGATAAAFDVIDATRSAEVNKIAIENLGLAIGTALLPVAEAFQIFMGEVFVPFLEQTLVPAFENISTFLTETLVPAFSNFFGFIKDNLPTVATFVGVLGLLLIAFNLQAVATRIATTVTTLFAIAQGILNTVMSLNPLTLVAIAVAALVAGIVYLATQTTFFQDIWAAMTEFVGKAWEGFKDLFVRTMEAIGDFFVGIGESLSESWEKTTDFLGGIWETFTGFIGGIWEGFKEGFDGIVNGFKTIFENVFNGIKSFFVGIVNGYINIFESFINFVIDGINGMIDLLNSIQINVPATALTDAFTIGLNLPNLSRLAIPRIALADGGYVDRPTNALIGEAGPEVVTPLKDFERMMGIDGDGKGKTMNYYAAPNQSIDSEQDLFQAMRRAKVVAGW
jgi:TP901 family phage tail tape measure protein